MTQIYLVLIRHLLIQQAVCQLPQRRPQQRPQQRPHQLPQQQLLHYLVLRQPFLNQFLNLKLLIMVNAVMMEVLLLDFQQLMVSQILECLYVLKYLLTKAKL